MKDLREIPEDYNQEQWGELINAMNSGEEVRVPDWFWYYFLEVLPPKYQGNGFFIFAEGAEAPTVFGGRSTADRRVQQFPSWAACRQHLAKYGVELPVLGEG